MQRRGEALCRIEPIIEHLEDFGIFVLHEYQTHLAILGSNKFVKVLGNLLQEVLMD
jgi:hypothetical protein